MRWLLPVPLILLAALPARAACQHDPAAIRAGEEAWAKAARTGDTAALNGLLADDFVGLSTDGAVYDRDGALRQAAAGGPTVLAVDAVAVRFHGDSAVAQGRDHWADKNGHGRFAWLDSWACLGGHWRIVGGADIHLAPGR